MTEGWIEPTLGFLQMSAITRGQGKQLRVWEGQKGQRESRRNNNLFQWDWEAGIRVVEEMTFNKWPASGAFGLDYVGYDYTVTHMTDKCRRKSLNRVQRNKRSGHGKGLPHRADITKDENSCSQWQQARSYNPQGLMVAWGSVKVTRRRYSGWCILTMGKREGEWSRNSKEEQGGGHHLWAHRPTEMRKKSGSLNEAADKQVKGTFQST